MEPEGASVEVTTMAPGGNTCVLEESGAETEAELEAGRYQEPLELDGSPCGDALTEVELEVDC